MSSKPAATSRLKLIAIPLLGAVLLGVVVWPSEKEESASPVLSPDRVARRKAAQTSAATAAKTVSWNVIPRADAREFNPFQAPRTATESIAAGGAEGNTATTAGSSATASNGTTQSPSPQRQLVRVQAVLDSAGQQMALIDGKLIKIGDELPGGGKVASISAAGVVVEMD